jgi:hypothetical protein
MSISNEHNVATRDLAADRPFGIRVRIPKADPFARLIDPEWEAVHWYPTAAERDAAMTEMARRHRYSRIGDEPSILLEPVKR